MNWVIAGLPLHPLLVHASVILIPLAALCTVLSLIWPTARRRLGIVTPILAFAALGATVLTVQAGEALAEVITPTALSGAHVAIGGTVRFWIFGLFLVAAAQWLWFRYFGPGQKFAARIPSASTRTVLTVVLAVAVAITSVGSVVSVVIVGDTGAQAVWAPVISGTK
ncbi:DUF2231 domain-containing protein [Cryobacterium sp. GrIS_2_6]|uniref:DUF2231 domain-containing protein n=1 Tax=Cryobacterium sp. GrIS_2_6 TaxID=3162785 RepID=UPI002E030791|nr:putative membrane protein [Cryobacterium psychrotolerans]